MCTRFSFDRPEEALARVAEALAMKLRPLPEWAKPRYNVTLTHGVPVVAAGADGAEWREMKWGLAPFYERDKPHPQLLANAKAETAGTLTLFRESTVKRRCLVPANGFYEWQKVGKARLPHYFTLKGEEPFALAGIWESGGENTPETFVILTTTPNALVAPIHNRMPVILTSQAMPRWLGSEPLSPEAYAALTQPLAAIAMQEREVSPYVSNSRNEGPPCHAPPEPPLPELAFG